ncbi:hypothetical protein TRVL_09592 [Trypanosoma vivax]|nr:hypothetical protein TRVL_09592 [Trypanosoma vivax]
MRNPPFLRKIAPPLLPLQSHSAVPAARSPSALLRLFAPLCPPLCMLPFECCRGFNATVLSVVPSRALGALGPCAVSKTLWATAKSSYLCYYLFALSLRVSVQLFFQRSHTRDAWQLEQAAKLPHPFVRTFPAHNPRISPAKRVLSGASGFES